MGLILPPLLTIMDDYETTYRDHGLRCLETLLDKVNATTLKRMGIDKLFLKVSVAWQLRRIDRALILIVMQSVQHSISLHPSPPNPPILVHALKVLFRLLPLIHDPSTTEHADEIALAVEHGIKDGWQYAPSVMDGIEIMIEIGMAVELVSEEVDTGIIRWLNASRIPIPVESSHES